jgi:arylsulfatase A-like enzyme
MLRGSRTGLLLAIVSACARAPLAAGGQHPACFALVPVGASSERAPVRSVLRCVPAEAAHPNERGAWTVTAPSHRFETEQDSATGRAALVLASDGQARVRILGPFQQEDFNQVAIHLAAAGNVQLGLSMEHANGAEKVLGRRELHGGGERTTLVFDVPAARPPPGSKASLAIEALAIRIFSSTPRLEIEAVELFFQPWEKWLPDTSQPELVMIEQEGRRAVGLTSGRPLECTLRAPAGARLCFSFAYPPYLPRAAGRTDVLVQVFDGESEALHERYQLTDRHGESFEGWQAGALDLAPLASHELRVRFSLRGAATTACALAPPYLTRPGSTAPTVLLITSDTHRADHLGCAPGTAGLETPALDALAARGVLFEDCFSQANATRPSHAVLMTAMHPRDHGVVTNEARLSAAAPTLAEVFRSAGYLTFAAVSAAPVYPVESGLEQGFERYSRAVGRERRGDETIAEVMRWLPDAEGTPLFVWLHVFDAHAPYEPPADLATLYFPMEGAAFAAPIPLPENLDLGWQPRVVDLRYIAASYKSEVTALDRELAEVFEHPRLGAGIVAFTADHGESLYSHDLYFTHSGLYTDTLRIPLILVWPGAPAGRRVGRAVQQMDVGRTLLDLVGLAELEFPGEDLMAEDGPSRPRFALAANRWCASVTLEGWHLILHLRGRTAEQSGLVLQPRRRHQTELYDLRVDPSCEHDLVDANRDQARKLRTLLVEWLLEAPEKTWCEEPAVADMETLEELQALGYATGDAREASNVWWDSACRCAECQKFE